ncbi:hypothetical protein HELRODRAFT_170514 [Helobdella robusta]|uniref:SFR19-like C-terminal domain-containing protein n=1 Tax=Helobdella robusta TaxID=6412 RepID=T1F355_HELRO|nr:hypothetical protein HELRODRAFT_170514 [Helobdella robusta]ESO07203.1 hypothetical protein HELRODRAFT_170514 [Helobdella robusta]
MENDKLENVCDDEIRENFININNSNYLETENITADTDEQQNENNFNNNNDGRSSEEDEDELTRKIRAIPILPRIPKLKKADSSGEIPRQQTLEHRSILQRKDSIINPDQSLKWPTESFGGFGSSRRNNINSFNKFSNQSHNGSKKFNNNCQNSSNIKNLNNSIEHNFNKNNHNKNFNLINSKRDQKTEPQTTHMTYSSFKRSKQGLDQADSNQNLTSEEKFDQIFKKKDMSNNHLEPLTAAETDNVFNNLSEADDFDSFDNNILNTIAKTPCKTIEDRYRERMQKGLKTAQMESIASCSKSDLTNNDDNLYNNEQLSQDYHSNANSNQTLRKSQTCPDSLSKVADTDNVDSSDDSKSSPNDNDKSLGDKSGSLCRKVVTFNCPDANESSALLKNKKLPKKKKIDEVCPKSSSQEKVVSIMKEFLKPYYSKQKITKDQYKEIMRKSVPKFSKIKPGDIKIDKIHSYAMKLLKEILPRK